MPLRKGGLGGHSTGTLFDRPGFFDVANIDNLTVNTKLLLKAASETYGIEITHADTSGQSQDYEIEVPTVSANDEFMLTGLAQTLTNKTLASPKITTGIYDTNGNELLLVTATGSAVNELTLANAATGNDPILSATGGDTNIGITLTPKGSGIVRITGGLTVDGETTTIDSTTLLVEDKNIEMGSVDTPSDTTADGGGITLKGATDKTLIWDNANDNWTSNQDWNIASGKVFKINNVSMLSNTTLGSSVVTSSLTTVGTVTSGIWNAGAVTSSGAVTGASLVADNTTLDNNTLSTSSGDLTLNPSVHLQIQTGDNKHVLFTDSLSDATIKQARIGVKHYTNAEEPVAILVTYNNNLGWGGGTAHFNAATEHRFFTATNTTTTMGTARMVISSTGLVSIGGNLDVTGTLTGGDLTISGTSTTIGTVTSGTWEGTTIAVDQGGTGATSLNNLITLSTHTTGNYVATITGGTGITSSAATSGEGTTHSLSIDAAQTQITSVGALNAGSITSGFGTIDTGSSTITTTGVITAGGLTIGSAAILEAELEILDGANVTTTELNLIDGGTARDTNAVASGDGILINDAGTMHMTNVDTVSTYFSSHNVGGSNIVTTGALDSGSITSGFGAINTGSSNITTTGTMAGGDLTISGTSTTIGTVTSGIWNAGALTSSGAVTGASLVADLTTIDSNTISTSSGSLTLNPYTNLLIQTGNNSTVLFTDMTTDAATKQTRIGLNHYTNAEEPVAILFAQSSDTTNLLSWGGGTSLFNAATEHKFYTAANQTTVTGTERLSINSAGLVSIGGDLNVTGTLTGGDLTISGTSTTIGTVTSGTWEGTTVAVDQGGTGATSLNNLITLSTHTTGNYVATITGGTGITSSAATSGEGTTHSLSIDASQTQITSVGTLDAGSITSNFGTINTGSSAISSTGTVTTGALVVGGDISTASAQDWDLIDNNSSALSFDAAGKSGILEIVTTDGSEKVAMSGDLTVAGNMTVTGTTTQVDTVTMNAANAVVFEGATADEYETILTIVDPTADHTVYMPNQTGYLPVLSGASTTQITSTPEELNLLDGITAGTVAASKAVIVDASKDIGTFRNLTIDGVFTDGNYTFDTSGNVSGLGTIGSGAITSSGVVTATGFTIGSAAILEAELEILDGASVTTTELNLIDGGTSRDTNAVASGDGILINDAGTMHMTNVDTVSTYFASHSVGGSNIVTTGALDSGSITSGFGAINTGSSNITTTGTMAGGDLTISGTSTIGTVTSGIWNAGAVTSSGAVTGASIVADNITLDSNTISASSSLVLAPAANLNIQTGDGYQVVFTDSSSDATTKQARIGVKHYTNAEEASNILFANNSSEANSLLWGGGTSLFNAATDHRFYTAANTTTTTGTERLAISSAGVVSIGGNLDMKSTGTILNVGAAGNDWTQNNLTLNGGTANQFITAKTTGAASQACLQLIVPSSNTNVARIRFQEGTGSGDANNQAYLLDYIPNSNRFRFYSADIDGSSNGGDIFQVADGTNDIKFVGGISTDGQSAPTSGINTGSADITTTGTLIGGDLTISGTSTTIGTVTSGIWNAGALTSSGAVTGASLVADLTTLDANTLSTSSGALTLSPATDVLIPNDKGMVIGHTAQVQVGHQSELQILGTGAPDSALHVARWHAGTGAPSLSLGKSRNASIGSFTIVADNDPLGFVSWYADDGVNMMTQVSQIKGEVDDASPAANQIGGALIFSVADGDTDDNLTERLRIASSGLVSIGGNLDMKSSVIANVGAAGNNWFQNYLTLNGGTASQFITAETTGAASQAELRLKVPASNTSVVRIRFQEGTGSGDANNQAYLFDYLPNSNRFRFYSADVTGSADGGDIFRVADGTNDIKYQGGLSTDGIAAPVKGIYTDSLGVGLTTGTPLIKTHIYESATTGTIPLPVLALELSDDGADTDGGEGPAINFYVADYTVDSTGAGTIYARKGIGSSHLAGQIATVKHYVDNDNQGAGDMVFATANNASALVEKMRISYIGDVTGTHGDYHVASDERVKKDIVTIPNALTKVAALRGVNFKWKDADKGTKLRMGLIAQEVEAVVPELVHTQEQAYINESEEEEGGLKAVEYQYITGLLIEAIKELKTEIDELKNDRG